LNKLAKNDCKIIGDRYLRKYYKGKISKANEKDWSTEYLAAVVSVKCVKNLEDAIADLKEKVGGEQKEIEEDLSAEVKEELSAEPKEIKHNPEAKSQVELTKIGKVSDLRQRVFSKIFNS